MCVVLGYIGIGYNTFTPLCVFSSKVFGSCKFGDTFQPNSPNINAFSPRVQSIISYSLFDKLDHVSPVDIPEVGSLIRCNFSKVAELAQ